MDPRERLATFAPAYVTEATVEWLEGLNDKTAGSLAAQLSGASQLQSMARKLSSASPVGKVKLDEDSAEWAIGYQLGLWRHYLLSDLRWPEPDPAFVELEASAAETHARLTQLSKLLYDIHGFGP